jgi:hypothetical protein
MVRDIDKKKKKDPFTTDVSRERKKQFDIRKQAQKGKDQPFIAASTEKAQGTTRFDLAKGRPDIQAEFERQDLVQREAFEKKQASRTQLTQLLALTQTMKSKSDINKLQNLARAIEEEQLLEGQEEQPVQEGQKKKGFGESVAEGLDIVGRLGGLISEEQAALGEEQGLLGQGVPLTPVASVPTGLFGKGVQAGTTGDTATVSSTVSAHRLTRTAVAGTNILQREQLLGLGTKTATRSFIGKPGNSGVNKIFSIGGRAEGAKVAMNTKTMTQAETILSGGVFSTKAMVLFGSWASSVFLGRWAQAEAPEAIAIPLRDALRQANETGDFSIYDEYSEAAREITDVSIWREIALWSPIAAIPGIESKIKGVRKGVELIDAIAQKDKLRLGIL